MAANSASSPGGVGRKAGTLVVIVMKAKNLPNRQKIGKQDPYAIVRLAHTAERTKTDKRGGQSPFWDHETRFPIPLNRGADYSTLKITVFSDDSREPVLIGDASIDLKSVFKDGEFDEWVELSFKQRYAGEVYLEMTYYSEAPPPVPALPKEAQSRGLQSRGLESREGGRIKRRPLPQQPDIHGLAPPPSRGTPPSRGLLRHSYEDGRLPTSYSNPPPTSYSIPPRTSHSMPPSTSYGLQSSYSYPDHYADQYQPDPYDRHPRPRSFCYEQHYSDYESQQSLEYSPYSPPDPSSLGRHRSEMSLRTQYYETRPLHEAEQTRQRSPTREGRPRTSLPLPEPHVYDYERPPLSNHNLDSEYRQPFRRKSLGNYYSDLPEQSAYHTPPRNVYQSPPSSYQQPPPTGYQQPLPATVDPAFDDPEEPIPVHPYISSRRQSSPPLQTYQQNYSPSQSARYSPNTPPQPRPSQNYSPTPPPHRVHPTPPQPPPSRSSASPRSPLNGPAPPLKKPTPIRAIDHLPPSSYAPEHTPPSQRRALPTPPVNSSPSEHLQQSSPLAYRAPEIPAKIPLGMTEQEFWAVREEEGDDRTRGLEDREGWRMFREALPRVDGRR